ncbi:hypothetical protein KR222_009900 [Zaprionus bogoriensis]|nr:hypothetical protein KR222_009900 [Zaprionus bogoriensis]
MRDDMQLEISSVAIKLDKLEYDQERDYWYTLKGSNPMVNYGQLLLRHYYLNDLIMPAQAYASLQQLLLGPDNQVFWLLRDVCLGCEQLALAQSLLDVATRENCDHLLLQNLSICIALSLKATALPFELGKLENTLVDLYLRRECAGYLKATLGETVQSIAKRCPEADGKDHNLDVDLIADDEAARDEALWQSLDSLAQAIFHNDISFPKALRSFCNSTQWAVAKEWPLDRIRHTTCVSQVIFGRLFRPALCDPQQFGLLEKRPSAKALGILSAVASCLWQLATLCELDIAKFPDFAPLNAYIREHKDSVVHFVDLVSCSPAIAIGNSLELHTCSSNIEDSGRDLDLIHCFCASHYPQLENLPDSAWKEKLLSVTDDLIEQKSTCRKTYLAQRERSPTCRQLDGANICAVIP